MYTFISLLRRCHSEIASGLNCLFVCLFVTACSTLTFSSGYPTHKGSVTLVALPRCEEGHSFSVLKIIFQDVKWTSE